MTKDMRPVTKLMLVGLGFVLFGVILVLSNIALHITGLGALAGLHPLAILTSLVGLTFSLWGIFVISCNLHPWFFGENNVECHGSKKLS